MALDPKKNHNDIKNEIQKERRSFLKKTVYAAPSIIALGQLVRPSAALGASGYDNNNGVGGGVGGGNGNGNGWGRL